MAEGGGGSVVAWIRRRISQIKCSNISKAGDAFLYLSKLYPSEARICSNNRVQLEGQVIIIL